MTVLEMIRAIEAAAECDDPVEASQLLPPPEELIGALRRGSDVFPLSMASPRPGGLPGPVAEPGVVALWVALCRAEASGAAVSVLNAFSDNKEE